MIPVEDRWTMPRRRCAMRVLAVHPGPLMYTKIYLRLEPLGLELVAAAVRRAGHEVRLIDLQVQTHADYVGLVDRWRPDVVAFSDRKSTRLNSSHQLSSYAVF